MQLGRSPLNKTRSGKNPTILHEFSFHHKLQIHKNTVDILLGICHASALTPNNGPVIPDSIHPLRQME